MEEDVVSGDNWTDVQGEQDGGQEINPAASQNREGHVRMRNFDVEVGFKPIPDPYSYMMNQAWDEQIKGCRWIFNTGDSVLCGHLNQVDIFQKCVLLKGLIGRENTF